MPELEWSPKARAELLALIEYIADENPDAAQHLKDDIEVKAAKLPEHPKLYREGRVAGTREMIVTANYIVVYKETDAAVRILNVIHAAMQWPPV
ncbi:addiction module antitoxin (plasmid) [Acidihalobacter aeolianus]|uniref:Addiction module antitoxin n=1 Tax=Acidihalobacter aeolianus TaxID=2792603 RepID=A0A1D8KCM2_9GAMM|nr:type II toxin-antitoxin system RelE/ParE family toxin [Acidihalobacter aeolianus]AOV18709.1 addiction module antitoxin [Acidihalobacter aeolianus]